MVRSVKQKMESVRSRIKNLVDQKRGCYFCNWKCYDLISLHLPDLENWLTQAKKLSPAVFDRELLWIFGGTRVSENHNGFVHSIKDDNSDSEAESHMSFSSIKTQESNPAQKKRKLEVGLQSLPNLDDADDADVFLTDDTADSDADGLDSGLLEGGGTNDSSKPSCCNSRVHHEVATGVTEQHHRQHAMHIRLAVF